MSATGAPSKRFQVQLKRVWPERGASAAQKQSRVAIEGARRLDAR
jgi:hypothetical protein